MPEIPVYDHEAVLAAVSPGEAIDRVREGFVAYAHGDWQMPAKTYVEVPNGDFRAMPAQGGGLAILKWITSFPGNPERGLPVVQGVISVSRAETGEPLALIDARAVTALRTGAVAAVAAQELAREDAATPGIIGCGVYGSWAARCLAAAEYGPGVCFDPDPDAPGKAEMEIEAVVRCRLFADEWRQASHGGELTGAVEGGRVTRDDVTELGDVITGRAPGRSGADSITLFDSTGLAIQDLALCHAVIESGAGVRAQTVRI